MDLRFIPGYGLNHFHRNFESNLLCKIHKNVGKQQRIAHMKKKCQILQEIFVIKSHTTHIFTKRNTITLRTPSVSTQLFWICYKISAQNQTTYISRKCLMKI